MQLDLTGRNLYIVNKKPQNVASVKTDGTMLILRGADYAELDAGQINLTEDLYACLYCSQLKNITFIINRGTAFNTSLIMAEETEFKATLELIKATCPTLELSEQNAKINGYAMSVVEKLKEGTAVKVLETKDEEGIKCCPMCGMQCDPNIPYCMECGASV